MSVTVYEHKNFKGNQAKLKAGKYPVIPIGIDKLSSVKVEPGSYAVFFITRGFRDGSFTLFPGEYPNFGSMDNKIDSVKVFDHDSSIFPIISFYTNTHFKGIQQNLAGTGQVTNFDSPFIKHDVFSSVKVPEGVTLTIFKHSNRQGPSLTLDAGEYKDLGIFGFNDVASSVQIVQNNLEVTNIKYTNSVTRDGEPIIIDSIAQNGSSLEQQVNLTLETAYEETFTRSFSNSTLFGLEISTTANVGVELGPLSASVEQTVTTTFENTFTFGKEESKTKTINISKELNVSVPPENIAKAVMTLTPQQVTIDAIYTLRLKGTDLTTKQNVTIESKSAAVGMVIVEKFTPIAQ
ncbi:toxin ETX/toxin MTX2 [Aquimarina amphilecti]|uniref:Toxin ETX/toxin MTX2 n=1 Tax=Aquimarina amphilecti TaxID=1038014 RepID=A0A1H7Q742_AQUAM|nr:beta/gamma crystallin-related protein [Aquimarina amphilecti]SEL43315.1 toxin ETX/toxin MTX2 [Aquimarina amphilecti]